MKKIKIRVSTLLSATCSVALSILGFGCSSDDDPECMYGTPTGSFEIKGTVTTEDGKDVEGAEIRVTDPDTPSGLHSYKISQTDEEGKYIVEGKSFPHELKVVCIPMGNTLEADSIIVDAKFSTDKDHPLDSWYWGHLKETVNFKLKDKKTEE